MKKKLAQKFSLAMMGMASMFSVAKVWFGDPELKELE